MAGWVYGLLLQVKLGPSKRCDEFLTSNTYGCDIIWKLDLVGVIK